VRLPEFRFTEWDRMGWDGCQRSTYLGVKHKALGGQAHVGLRLDLCNPGLLLYERDFRMNDAVQPPSTCI